MVKKIVSYCHQYGLVDTICKILRSIRNILSYTVRVPNDIYTEKELEEQRVYPFKSKPLVSIIIPAFNTPINYLEELFVSVQNQSYSNWELCIADGNSSSVETIASLKEYASKDPRIRPVFLKENLGISGNTNAAIAVAKGEYIVFADHDDTLAPNALFEVVRAFTELDADFVYSDEDKIDEKSRWYFNPHFKPDFSPEYLYSGNYICHISAVRREKLVQIGGLHSEYDGSQDHDFNLWAYENGLKFVHIPKVLYHWRVFHKSVSNQNLEKCYEKARSCVQAHLNRCGIEAEVVKGLYVNKVNYAIIGDPRVSIIIPFEDKATIQKIVENTEYSNFDFFSTPEEADGEYIVFIREDALPDSSLWLKELLMLAQHKDVAAVGGAVFSKKNKVLHRGIFFSDGYAMHSYLGLPETDAGFAAKIRCVHELSAVDDQLAITRRNDYLSFLADYPGEDFISYCLSSLRKGNRILYTPYATAHLSSNSINVPYNKKKYDTPFVMDPYYNPNLSTETTDWRIKRRFQQK